MRVVVGVTGASGAIYAVGLLEALKNLQIETHLVVTPMGEQTLRHECGLTVQELGRFARLHQVDDLFSPLASGSFRAEAMVVVPCSMHTLGAMAGGLSDNLLTRSAHVMLKEGRKLVVVPRETPLDIIHLENMLRLARAGAHILPASPAFYHRPQDLAQAITFVVGKILDVLEIDHDIFPRWGKA